MAHLGEVRYSFVFPLFVNVLLCVLSEMYAYGIAKNPMIVGVYIIFLNVAFILYFAFRQGLRGGFISSAVSILYYFYIIYTRHYTGAQLSSGVETTLILGVLYFILAGIIGWLKQRIDKLIERETDEKKRLETILQQLPVGILITDSSGTLIQRNSQVDTILGVNIPLGFTIGKDTLDREKIDGKPVNPSQAPLFQALQSGKPVIGKEFTFERRDGKTVSLQVSSAPILNKFNKVIAAASIINDITQLKELERQKDEFLAIASHELKTPVTSIKAYGQVLQSVFRRKGDAVAVEQLQKMDAQINKLTNLIADLLDVTKIQSGRLEFHKDYFDFNALVSEVVDELQLTTTKHHISLQLAQSTQVCADKERIGQVLINLISNAIKYSPSADSGLGLNRGKIIVRTALDSENITVSVQDFGVGIPPDKQGHVFEQFFRVNGPMQNTFPGLGLGLYISAEIVKREGGRIWVESVEGEGSTFYFTLPLTRSSG
jgi:signal transduction histidine kinase